MKKASKKTLRNKLDKVCSLLVRARGKCEKCGSRHELQTAHVFSRSYNNTRWDIENNLLCLCASCHFIAHKEPVEFVEWVKKYLGEDRYELLRESHNQITKFTVDDLQIKLKVLLALITKK